MHTLSEVSLKYHTQTTHKEKPKISTPEDADQYAEESFETVFNSNFGSYYSNSG